MLDMDFDRTLIMLAAVPCQTFPTIPTSIGYDSMLTIAALSERIAEKIILSPANRDLLSASMNSQFVH